MSAQKEIENLIKLTCNIFEAFSTILFTWQGAPEKLKPFSSLTLSKNFNPKISILPGEGLIGSVASRGEPIRSIKFKKADQTIDALPIQYYSKEEPIHTFLAVPVIHQKATLGVLTVDSKKSFAYGKKELKILAGFAEIIAQTLHSFYQEKEQKKEQLSSSELSTMIKIAEEHAQNQEIYDILVEEFSKILRSFEKGSKNRGALIVLKSPETKSFQIVAAADPLKEIIGWQIDLENSLLGWVVRHREALYHWSLERKEGKPHLFNNQDSHFKIGSFVAHPFGFSENNEGVLALFDEKPNGWQGLNTDNFLTLSMTLGFLSASERSLKPEDFYTGVDPVTGLLDYTTFCKILPLWLNENPSDQSLKKQKFLSKNPICALLVIDIDDFSTLNMLKGEIIANEVLRQTGKLLTALLGSKSLIARYGGGQFIAVQEISKPVSNSKPGKYLSKSQQIQAELKNASVLVDKIRKTIEDTSFSSPESEAVDMKAPNSITACIGVALTLRKDQAYGKLIHTARLALDKAKKIGLNQYSILYFDN